MPRNNVNRPDNFCYACRDLKFKDQRRSLTYLVKKYYELYFGVKLVIKTTRIFCSTYAKRLTDWIKRMSIAALLCGVNSKIINPTLTS